MKKAEILKVGLWCLSAAALFTISVITVMKTEKISGADISVKDEPYVKSETAQNTNILVNTGDGYAAVFGLDFESGQLNVLILDLPSKAQAEKMGYPISEELNADYLFIMHFIDSLGGIDMYIFSEDEPIKYTGVQVCNILEVNKGSIETRRKIILAIAENIAVNGLKSETLEYIINGETSLSYPDVYYWKDSLPRICQTVNTVN